MTPIWLKQTPTGIILNLHCQPGAKQTKVVGLHDGCLKISLQAPALENKANELLLAWLSKQLRVPQKQIQFVSGQNSRKKRVEIWGPISPEQIAQMIAQKVGRGATFLWAEGSYTHNHKKIVLCACNNKELYIIRKNVLLIDPEAFVVIMDSNEVLGEGFIEPGVVN